VFNCLNDYFLKSGSKNRNSLLDSENWDINASNDIELKLQNILNYKRDPAMVYRVEYIDNYSVGGDALHHIYCSNLEMHNSLFRFVSTPRFYVLFFLMKNNQSEEALERKISEIFIDSYSTKWLRFNLLEACLQWRKVNCPSLIIAASKVLGPTISDQDVINNLGD